jgi:hypothetical protein
LTGAGANRGLGRPPRFWGPALPSGQRPAPGGTAFLRPEPSARPKPSPHQRPPPNPSPKTQLFGIDLAKLINKDGKEFIFNEFGIGGGATVTGDQPARTVAQVEDGPFFGVYGPYTRKLDPWRLFLPCERAQGAGPAGRSG